MPLEVTQRRFLTAVTRKGGDSFVASELFRRPPEGTIEGRFSIYATGLIPRVVEALEDDYPALRRIVGQGPFTSLGARYIDRHPSGSFDLGRVGESLALFLRGDPLSDDLPFLSELAELEWALSRAFVAADAEPVAWAELQGLGDEAVADLPLRLVPGTCVVRSTWPLVRLWSLKDVPDAGLDLRVEQTSHCVLVRRRGYRVVPIDVDEVSARLVGQAERGGSLAELLARGSSREEIDQTVSAFRGLVVAGVFSKAMVSGGLAPGSN